MRVKVSRGVLGTKYTRVDDKMKFEDVLCIGAVSLSILTLILIML